jgi:hypothetical protein
MRTLLAVTIALGSVAAFAQSIQSGGGGSSSAGSSSVVAPDGGPTGDAIGPDGGTAINSTAKTGNLAPLGQPVYSFDPRPIGSYSFDVPILPTR